MTDEELKEIFKNPPFGCVYPSKETIDNNILNRIRIRDNDKLIELHEFLTSIGYGIEIKRLEPFTVNMSLGVLTDCFIEICVGKNGTDYIKTGYVFSFSSLSNTMDEMFDRVLIMLKKDFKK